MEAAMGVMYAELVLRNPANDRRVAIRARVDLSATALIVTPAVSRALGFAAEDLKTSLVTVSIGRRIPVARIAPLQIAYCDRDCHLEAVVLGDENRVGFVPLEAMDLIVDPVGQRLVGRHPAVVPMVFE
jgi:hypothetical protein